MFTDQRLLLNIKAMVSDEQAKAVQETAKATGKIVDATGTIPRCNAITVVLEALDEINYDVQRKTRS